MLGSTGMLKIIGVDILATCMSLPLLFNKLVSTIDDDNNGNDDDIDDADACDEQEDVVNKVVD